MTAEFNGGVKCAFFILAEKNRTPISRREIEEAILKTPKYFPNLLKTFKTLHAMHNLKGNERVL